MSNLAGLGLLALIGFLYVWFANSSRMAYEAKHKDDWKKKRHR